MCLCALLPCPHRPARHRQTGGQGRGRKKRRTLVADRGVAAGGAVGNILVADTRAALGEGDAHVCAAHWGGDAGDHRGGARGDGDGVAGVASFVCHVAVVGRPQRQAGDVEQPGGGVPAVAVGASGIACSSSSVRAAHTGSQGSQGRESGNPRVDLGMWLSPAALGRPRVAGPGAGPRYLLLPPSGVQ